MFCFVKNLKTYGFDFGFLSFVVWISVGESLWTSWASRDILERPLLSKIMKNSCFFRCFFENAAFGVFDAFDGCFESFASLFGRFSSTMASKMGFEKVQTVIKNETNNELKNKQKKSPKRGPKINQK